MYTQNSIQNNKNNHILYQSEHPTSSIFLQIEFHILVYSYSLESFRNWIEKSMFSKNRETQNWNSVWKRTTKKEICCTIIVVN